VNRRCMIHMVGALGNGALGKGLYTTQQLQGTSGSMEFSNRHDFRACPFESVRQDLWIYEEIMYIAKMVVDGL